MRAIVTAQVIYTCELNEEQINALKNKLKEERKKHNFDMDEEDTCCAIMSLYNDTDTVFELYKNSEESDFFTEEIQKIEFDDEEEEEKFFEEINENA